MVRNGLVKYEIEIEEEIETKIEEIKKDDIDFIYKSYPTKCPINNSSTGKSKNDKDKIKNLLSNTSKDQLIFIINTYIAECKQSNRYIKNFSTFLNNLPDYEQPKKEIPINDGKERFTVMYDGDPKRHKHSEQEIKDHCVKHSTRLRSRL